MHDIIEVDERLKIDFDRREVWLEGKARQAAPHRIPPAVPPGAERRLGGDPRPAAGQKVWGYEYRDEPHYVRLYINYLRQKLEKDPANPKVHPDRARGGLPLCGLQETKSATRH
jgi:two-component system, OmpR family, alkaline phosphatase synthesis response regulator PhoP